MRKKLKPADGRTVREGMHPYAVIPVDGKILDTNQSWVQRSMRSGDLVNAADLVRAKKGK